MHIREDRPGVIYGLHNGDGVIRYVGLTTVDPARRLSDHRKKAHNSKLPVYNWMRKHGRKNIQFKILATADSVTELCELEMALIEEMRANGANLLNVTLGGETGSGWVGEDSPQAKLTETQVRGIVSELAGGRPLQSIADDYGVARATICDIDKGVTWKHVPRPDGHEPRSRSVLNEDDVRAIRQALTEGARGIDLAAQYGVSRTVISGIRTGRLWKDITNG